MAEPHSAEDAVDQLGPSGRERRKKTFLNPKANAGFFLSLSGLEF